MGDMLRLHESWEPVVREHVEIPAEQERSEALREAVRERIAEARQAPRKGGVSPAPTLAAPSPNAASKQDIHPKEQELRALNEKGQIAFLAHLALEQGVEPAVELAERIGSEYVIDAFHDLLVDRLLDIIARRSQATGA